MTTPKHNTGDVEQQIAELMVCHSHGYMCQDCPLEANVKKVVALIAARVAEADIQAQKDYIEVTLGWMEPNASNLTVEKIIATLKEQLEAERAGDV